MTSDGSVLATGSLDTTVMVWEVFRGRNLEKRVRSTQTELPRKDYVIFETSGSKDGRSLRHPSGCALSKLVASRHGKIVSYVDDDLSLHLYSINVYLF